MAGPRQCMPAPLRSAALLSRLAAFIIVAVADAVAVAVAVMPVPCANVCMCAVAAVHCRGWGSLCCAPAHASPYFITPCVSVCMRVAARVWVCVRGCEVPLFRITARSRACRVTVVVRCAADAAGLLRHTGPHGDGSTAHRCRPRHEAHSGDVIHVGCGDLAVTDVCCC